MLDLNDLRKFVLIVDQGGIASAARVLGIQTSTLSRRLSALEAETGVDLIDRGPGRFRVTELGKELYDRCLPLVREGELVADFVAHAADRRKPASKKRRSPNGVSVDNLFGFRSDSRRQDVVQQYILGKIRNHELEIGDKLPPERALSAMLGVSRKGVSEALRTLEISGVLRIERGAHGGAFIRETGSDGLIYAIRNMLILGRLPLRDILEIRTSVVGQSARLATLRGDEETFRRMEGSIDRLEKAVATGESMVTVDPAKDFYTLLARASRNGLMEMLVEALLVIIVEILTDLKEWPMVDSVGPRREIVAALRKGDADAAERVARRHSDFTNKILMKFEERDTHF